MNQSMRSRFGGYWTGVDRVHRVATFRKHKPVMPCMVCGYYGSELTGLVRSITETVLYFSVSGSRITTVVAEITLPAVPSNMT